MSLARVVSFDGVDENRIEQVRKEIQEGERPADIPATEVIVLHDAEAAQALAIVFFETDDDYARGDAALSAMPAGETPGQRTSVRKYEVVVRATP
jgi:hypothetical protein